VQRDSRTYKKRANLRGEREKVPNSLFSCKRWLEEGRVGSCSNGAGSLGGKGATGENFSSWVRGGRESLGERKKKKRLPSLTKEGQGAMGKGQVWGRRIWVSGGKGGAEVGRSFSAATRNSTDAHRNIVRHGSHRANRDGQKKKGGVEGGFSADAKGTNQKRERSDGGNCPIECIGVGERKKGRGGGSARKNL